MSAADIFDAAEMIAEEGQTVTITGKSGGDYDTTTGTANPDAYSKSAKAVILPLSPFRAARDSRVVAGDEQMLLSGLDASGATLPEPPNAATITLADGSKRTLIATDRLNPDGAGNILFDCIVRGVK